MVWQLSAMHYIRVLLLALGLVLLAMPNSSATRRLQQSSAVGNRGLAQPDYSYYHRLVDLKAKIADIVAANPSTMRVSVAGNILEVQSPGQPA